MEALAGFAFSVAPMMDWTDFVVRPRPSDGARRFVALNVPPGPKLRCFLPRPGKLLDRLQGHADGRNAAPSGLARG